MRVRTADWANTCYGVDWSEGEIHAVRAERVGRGLRISPARVADPVFQRETEAGVPVIAALSARESFVRWLDTPFTSEAKARKVLPSVLDIQLPFALEDCVYAPLDVVRTESNTVRTLALAARMEEIRGRLDALSAAGVDPAVLDHEGIAIWTQSLRESPREDEGALVRLVVHAGETRGTLVIGKGGRFIAAHAIRPEDPQAVVRLLLAGVGERPGAIAWFWAGSVAEDASRVERLHQALGSQWSGTSTVHDTPRTFLARALVTRALIAGPLRCNIRMGPLAHDAVRRRVRLQALRPALAVAAAGIVLMLAAVTTGAILKVREQRLDRRFTRLAEELAGYPLGGARGKDALRIAVEEAARRRSRLRPFREAFEPSLTHVIRAVTDIAGRHALAIDALDITGRTDVRIGGVAPEWGSCDELVSVLESEGYRVTLDRKEALAEECIPFAIATEAAHE